MADAVEAMECTNAVCEDKTPTSVLDDILGGDDAIPETADGGRFFF